jgi:hypothetical protein
MIVTGLSGQLSASAQRMPKADTDAAPDSNSRLDIITLAPARR